jgi:AcrR family transcriptional regulator
VSTARQTVRSEARSTRDAILDVAARHFAERGFAGASMREITAEAGLRNQASLYHHFASKRALYEAVLGRGVEPILFLVRQIQSAGDAGGDAFLDQVLDYLRDHPHLPRLIQRAGLDDARYLKKVVTQLLTPLYAQGLRVLAGASQAWPAAELPHVAVGLFHMIFGYFANTALLEVVLQDDPRGDAAVDRQRQFLKTAIRRLLEPQAPNVTKSRRRT